jgi:DUF4097 and DUF4098 domain-containing protein YvlB
VSARKIAFLILIVAFAATVETAWNVRGDVSIGPEGCRVMGGRFYGPSWTFEAAGERALEAGGTPRLEVKNAFGSVRVSAGAPGVVKVRLRKVVFLPTEEKARAFAERIELRLSGAGAGAVVATNRDELRREDTGFETHLEIEAPKDTQVEVRNEHGRVELADVASADVVSSFEGVTIERVAGDVALEARHGDVGIDGVGGGLVLSARHGSVEVASVAGSARLDVQHGDLQLRRTGAAEIELAHGALTAEAIAGDLLVKGQHAPVRAADVTGGAELRTSFGELRAERVGGELRARAEHGEVTATDVTGGANVEATHGSVTLERVAGPVEAAVEHGGVEGKALARGARVRTTGGDVSLTGFAGPLDLQIERGGARLSPGAPLDAELSVRAIHGGVELEVPDGSRFDLEAASRTGKVEAPLDGIRSEDAGGRGARAAGRHGGGGVSVRLDADGDIKLEPHAASSREGWTVARPRVGDEAKSAAEAAPAAPAPAPAVKKPAAVPAAPAEAPPAKSEEPQPKAPDGEGHTR